MEKKGFFFVIVAFVLLSYILASTYIWVRAIEMEESRYSESFRTSSMEMLVDQLSDEQVSKMADVMANYAFYRLDNHSIRNPVEAGIDDSPEEFDNIKLALSGLILSGSASDAYFEGVGTGLEYSSEEKEGYTLYGWGQKLNESLSASGFMLEKFEIHQDSFILNQTDYLVYEVNFTMDLVIRDKRADSATSMTRTYQVSTIVNATGMVDPYIARESIALNLPGNQIAERQLFMAPYDFEEYMGRTDLGYDESYPSGYPSDVSDWEVSEVFESLCSEDGQGCYYMESGNAGQGWFYGPMVEADDASSIETLIATNSTQQYIVVGNYSDISELINHEGEIFGAYVLTNEPTESESACGGQMDEIGGTFNALIWEDDCDATIDADTRTFVPFVVSEGFDMGEYIGDNNKNKALFISQYSVNEISADGGDPALKKYPVALYDIEMFRDFVNCGYYLPRADSPSLLQRMFDIGDEDPMRAGEAFGIETSVAGTWAGGNLSTTTEAYDPYSRVEVEFFQKIDGSRIMGMPGCKNVFFCTDDSNSDVGQFRISPDAFERYNIAGGDGISTDNIACKDDPDGNNEHAWCEYEK